MSLVLAVEGADGVHVGCDSFIGTSSLRDLTDGPKWFWHSRELLVGYVGDLRAAHVAALAPRTRHTRAEEDVDYLRRVADVLRQTHGARAVELAKGTSFLMAYRGRCYEMQFDYSVFRNGLGYTAIGAGADVALGALAATPDMPPPERVKLALEVAVRHCPQVAAPLRYVALPPKRR